jgi:uncharacterized membrane protein (DUF485 family)
MGTRDNIYNSFKDTPNLLKEIKSLIGGKDYFGKNKKDINDYLEEGKRLYRESLGAKNEKEERDYLEKSKDAFDIARALSSQPIQKERINNSLREIQNRLRIMGIPLRSLENKIVPVFIFASFILAIFFISINITGAVVGSVVHDFSILGILFFLKGLVLSFIYARSKR